jgi:hypothetical protein
LKAIRLIGAVTLILAACGEKSAPAADTAALPAANTVAPCTEPVRKEVAFTAPNAKDVFEISVVGADCMQAAVLTTVHTASGVLLWSHADLASQTMAFAGIEQSGEKPDHALHALMEAWVGETTTGTTADAPDWPEAAIRPEGPTGLGYFTDFSREDYLAMHKEGRRMLCHPVYMNRTQCVVYYDGNGVAPYATEYFDIRS